MVKLFAVHVRENAKGSFISLELHGSPEMVQSQKTGRFYLTAKKCFISTTFDEETAHGMIGTMFPGHILRVPCDMYEFTLPETGEQILLAHRWDYIPEETPATNMVMANQV